MEEVLALEQQEYETRERTLTAQNCPTTPTVDHFWSQGVPVYASQANSTTSQFPSDAYKYNEEQPQQMNFDSSFTSMATNTNQNSIGIHHPHLHAQSGVFSFGGVIDQTQAHSIESLDFGSHMLNERDVSNMEPSLCASEVFKINSTLSRLEAPISPQENTWQRKATQENFVQISSQVSSMVDKLCQSLQKGSENLCKMASRISSKIVELTDCVCNAQCAELRNELCTFGKNVIAAIECAEEITKGDRVKNYELFEKVYRAAKDSITKIIAETKRELDRSYCEMLDGNKYKMSHLPIVTRWYTTVSQLTKLMALPCCDNQSKKVLSTSTQMTMLVGLEDPLTVDSDDNIIYNSSRGKLFVMQDTKSGMMPYRQLHQRDIVEVPEDNIRSFKLTGLASKSLYFLAYQSAGEYEIVPLWEDITHFKVLSPRRFCCGDHKIQIEGIEDRCFAPVRKQKRPQGSNDRSSRVAKKPRSSKTSDTVNLPSSTVTPVIPTLSTSQSTGSGSYSATIPPLTSAASLPAPIVLDGNNTQHTIPRANDGSISYIPSAASRASTTAPSYSAAPAPTTLPHTTGFSSSVATHNPEYTSNVSQSAANSDIDILLAPGSVVTPATGSLVRTGNGPWAALTSSQVRISSSGTLRIHSSPTPQPTPEQPPVQLQVPVQYSVSRTQPPVQYQVPPVLSPTPVQYPGRVQSPVQYQVPPVLSPTPVQYPGRVQSYVQYQVPPVLSPTPVQYPAPAPVQYRVPPPVQYPGPTTQPPAPEFPRVPPVQSLKPVQYPGRVQSYVAWNEQPIRPELRVPQVSPTTAQFTPSQFQEQPESVTNSDPCEVYLSL